VNFGQKIEFRVFYNFGSSKMSPTRLINYVPGRELDPWAIPARPKI
jgi:hypothetical protein